MYSVTISDFLTSLTQQLDTIWCCIYLTSSTIRFWADRIHQHINAMKTIAMETNSMVSTQTAMHARRNIISIAWHHTLNSKSWLVYWIMSTKAIRCCFRGSSQRSMLNSEKVHCSILHVRRVQIEKMMMMKSKLSHRIQAIHNTRNNWCKSMNWRAAFRRWKWFSMTLGKFSKIKLPIIHHLVHWSINVSRFWAKTIKCFKLHRVNC